MNFKKIIHGAVVLVVICLVAGALLGTAYSVTNPIIEAREMQEKVDAYQAVFTDADTFEEDDGLDDLVARSEEILEGSGYEEATINECLYAVDSSGNKIGWCMSISTVGDQDTVITAVCVDNDGTLVGISLLQNNETVGLGQKASDPDFTGQFAGKNVESFTVTKQAASSDNEVEAITGATITTDAVTLAVNAGMFFADYASANS